MANNVIVVGLPASGKSYFAKHYFKLTKMTTAEVIDDQYSIPEKLKLLSELVENDKSFILVDQELCFKDSRDFLIKFLSVFGFEKEKATWIYFENDPTQCLINARSREGKKVDMAIKAMSRHYFIPEEVYISVVPVWKP